MNCIGSNAPINFSTERKDHFRPKFNQWCENLSIIDTIFSKHSPKSLGLHTRISNTSSSRIDQILSSPDISWRTKSHTTHPLFSDHYMITITISDQSQSEPTNPMKGNTCRVKPYMVAPAAKHIDRLIERFFPPSSNYEPQKAANKMEALKKELPSR